MGVQWVIADTALLLDDEDRMQGDDIQDKKEDAQMHIVINCSCRR